MTITYEEKKRVITWRSEGKEDSMAEKEVNGGKELLHCYLSLFGHE